MSCLLRFLILVLSLSTLRGNLQSKLSSTQPTAVPCVVHTLQNYIDEALKITLRFSSAYEQEAAEIMSQVQTPVTVNAEEEPIPEGLDLRTQSNVIISLNPSPNVLEIANRSLRTSDTRVFLVGPSLTQLHDIFTQFWQFKMPNVFAFLPGDESTLVYSYLPYSEKDCSVGEPYVVDTWSASGFDTNGIVEVSDLSRLKNLNQCPVNVAVVDTKPNVIIEGGCKGNGSSELDGIEGRIMTEIARKLNMGAHYYVPGDCVGWGWIHPNTAGVAGDVFTQVSEFGFGLMVPSMERVLNLDMASPYNWVECITFGVPVGAGPKQATWINILVFEYSPTMWVLIGLCMIIFAIVYWLIGRAEKLEPPITKSGISLQVFMTMLGAAIPLPTHHVLRILIITLVWFSFILTVSYQSSLGSKLTVPTPDPDIDTFYELRDSGLKIHGYRNMLLIFEKHGVIKELADRYETTEYDVNHAVDLIGTERDIAYIIHKSTFLYNALLSSTNRGKIHLLRECVYVYQPIFVLPKKSPLTLRASQIISRLVESGITVQWRNHFIYNIPTPQKGVVRLSVRHMLGAFVILLTGYLVGLFIFLCECLSYHLVHKKKPHTKNK